jgi:DNA-directed RNA polymerase specialized sigma24 family protein
VVDLIRERDPRQEESLDKRHDDGQDVDDLIQVGSPSFDSPEGWLDYRAALDLIKLLPKQHQVVLIGQIVGVSDQELADQGFGTSAEAVKQTRKRAKHLLAALRRSESFQPLMRKRHLVGIRLGQAADDANGTSHPGD